MPVLQWNELTTTDFSRFDKDKTIALLPLGATEQHGPHLPLMVDACIADAVAHEAAHLVKDYATVLVLPPLTIGKSNEHTLFDGTLALSATTLTNMLMEIAESVLRTGITKFLLLNGHGGQSAITQIVARDLRVKHQALIVALNWWSVREKSDYFSEQEQMHGIHGGAEETAVMLHLRPDLVRKDRIENFRTTTENLSEEFPLLMKTGAKFGWMAQDLNAQGACGDATLATAEKGKQIFDDAASSLAALIKEMVRFDPYLLLSCRTK